MNFSSIKQNNSKLTEKQNSIVVDSSYPKYLRAGAGTGKTEVLIQKILNILREDKDCALDNFAIITFTNKATDEMRNRLVSNLYGEWLKLINTASSKEDAEFIRFQAEQISMVSISTIHSFCENLLRLYGLHLNLPLNFRIKSFRRETSEIISNIVSSNHGEHVLSGIPQYKIIKLIDLLLTNNSNRGITLDSSKFTFDTPDNNYWNDFKKVYIRIYSEAFELIEKEKIVQGVVTPNDLICKVVALLRNDYVSKKVNEKFKYVFIDEFQDTNKDQFELVNLLINGGVKVFLVGDDKQSIYAFRGADVKNSNHMHSIIQEISKESAGVYLDENFRTDDELLDIINIIFSHKFIFRQKEVDFPREPLVIPENKKGNSLPDCFKIEFESDIVQTILSAISNTKINDKPATFGDIAILCRRNYDLDKIASRLKIAGFPIEVVGGKGFYRSKEIIDTYKMFNAVIHNNAKHRKELIYTDYYKAVKANGNGTKFKSFLSELEVIFRRETVEETLTFMMEKSFIAEYYRSVKNYQAISNLQKLKDISRNLMSKENMQPLQFLDYLYIMISTSQDEDEADITEAERQEGVIRLYSIHKAKGLSFPIVIVPCIDNKLNRPITKPKIIFDSKDDNPRIAIDCEFVGDDFPPDRDYEELIDDEITQYLQEEIRVFYVACTRAKHQLILSGAKSYKETKASKTWQNYITLSKWLAEIDNGAFIEKYLLK